MEGIRRARAVCGGVGERIDDLQLLDDRARPSVRDDERQGILVLRADVDEVDVEAVDLGDEMREGLQSGLALAPVVLLGPVTGECLHRRELGPCRGIVDGFLLGPARGHDSRTQVIEIRFAGLDRERPDRRTFGGSFDCDRHVSPPWLEGGEVMAPT